MPDDEDFQPLYYRLSDDPKTYPLEQTPPPLRERLTTLLRTRAGWIFGVVTSWLVGVGVALVAGWIVPEVGAVGIGIGAGVWVAVRVFLFLDQRHQAALQERLDAESTSQNPLEALDNILAERLFNSRQRKDRLRHYVGNASFDMDIRQFILLHIASAVGLGVLMYLLTGGRLFSAVMIGMVGLVLPSAYIAYDISHRISRFKSQLPDTITLWVKSLRGGYSLIQALDALSKDAPQPTANEFRRVVQEMQMGVDTSDALTHLQERINDEDLDFVVTAVQINREVGGKLAEVLDVTGNTIRERVKLSGESTGMIKTRYRTFFALTTLLPILHTVVFSGYFERAVSQTTGQIALFLGYAMLSVPLMFGAYTHHALRRINVSSDNTWMNRRDRLFDLIFGLVLLSLALATGTSTLLVLWLGLLLFTIITGRAVLGGALALPVLATAIFTTNDLTDLPAQMLNNAPLTLLMLVVLGVSTVALWGLQRERPLVENTPTLPRLYYRWRDWLTEYVPFRSLLQDIADYDPHYESHLIQQLYVWSVISGVAGALVATSLAAVLGVAPLSIPAYLLVGAVIGYFAPAIRRYNRHQREKERIRAALPDALDLLVICVEAGLTLNAAIQRVYERWNHTLAEELGRVMREIQLGKLRREAFRNMARRLDIAEVNAFTAAIIQSDQVGVSIGRTLRVQADQTRVDWQRRFVNRVGMYNQITDQLSLFLFVPGITLWLLAPVIASL